VDWPPAAAVLRPALLGLGGRRRATSPRFATAASLRASLSVSCTSRTGFRTSHENPVGGKLIDDAVLHALVPQELVAAHRLPRPSPPTPVNPRHLAENPMWLAQAREAANPPSTAAAHAIFVQEVNGRPFCCPHRPRLITCSIRRCRAMPERVLVLMARGAENRPGTVESASTPARAGGGLLKVRLFARSIPPPGSPPAAHRIRGLPCSYRCRNAGSGAEPLCSMWAQALLPAWAEKPAPLPRLNRRQLWPGLKRLHPAMVKAVPSRPGPPRIHPGASRRHHRRRPRASSLPVDAKLLQPKPPTFAPSSMASAPRQRRRQQGIAIKMHR